MKRCGVIIIGGSGYGAGELLRLLSSHPALEVCGVVSRSQAGASIDSVHTHLLGIVSTSFVSEPPLEALSKYEKGAIILAMPSGQALVTLKDLTLRGLSPETIIIDLSGDLRLRDEAEHRKHYPEAEFAPKIRQTFRYGLSELSAERGAHITNPGCLATAAILAVAPFAQGKLRGAVVIDAKTGTSGAGRELQAAMHHPTRAHDFTAYKVLTHRHEPEILQALGSDFRRDHPVVFVPHLIPVSRGIFVTVYGDLLHPNSSETIGGSLRDFYRAAPFIRVRTAPPRLVDVVGTNFCDIFAATRGSQLVVMAALDNLGKGMAGQAIQNLNRELGLPEETGLLGAAVGPT